MKRRDKIGEHLKCAICLEELRDPRLLPQCSHYYCKDCIHRVARMATTTTITCPQCRKECPIPAQIGSFVEQLQPAHFVSSIKEVFAELSTDTTCEMCTGDSKAVALCRTCSRHICSYCKDVHLSVMDYKDHKVVDIATEYPSPPAGLLCLHHPMELCTKVYCYDCKHTLCSECIMDHNIVNEKKKHKFERLESLQQRVEDTVKDGLALEADYDKITGRIQLVEEAEVHLKSQFEEARQMVDEACDAAARCIETSREELLSTLTAAYQKESGNLSVRKTNLRLASSGCQEVFHVIGSLETPSMRGEELHGLQQRIHQQIEVAKQSCSQLNLQPVQLTDIQVTIPPNMCSTITDICSQCTIQKAYVTPLPQMRCPRYVRTIGNELASPWGIHVSPRHVYVTENSSPGSVCIFDHRGGFVKHISKLRNPNGTTVQLKHPSGITVDAHGVIYVASRSRLAEDHGLLKFDQNGIIVKKLTGRGDRPGEFNFPGGLSFGPDGNLYVCDCRNHRIQVFTPDLRPIPSQCFGQKGKMPGEFTWPANLTFDHHGNIYVADWRNHRVQMFTKERKFLCAFGEKGSGPGQFDLPAAVVVMRSGLILVTEEYNHRVSVFHSDGTYNTSFCQPGCQQNELLEPVGIAMDQEDHIYVCDTKNSRIQVFKCH